MTRTIYANNFPKKKLDSYLKKVKSKNVSELNQEQVYKVFDIARAEFIDFKLDLDDFAAICDNLWFDAIKEKGDEFANILLSASELSFYIRNAQSKENANIVAVNLNNILNYKKLT